MSKDEHQHEPCKGGHRHDISCREISEFLLAYVERDLDGEVHQEFERHLQKCPPCGHYLDSYRDTVELVRTCGKLELDKREHQRPPEDLIQAILTAKQREDGGGAGGADDSDA